MTSKFKFTPNCVFSKDSSITPCPANHLVVFIFTDKTSRPHLIFKLDGWENNHCMLLTWLYSINGKCRESWARETRFRRNKRRNVVNLKHLFFFFFFWAVWLVILFYPIVFKQAITNSPHTQQDCNQSCKAIESIIIFIVKSLFCWCLGICATDGQYLSAFQGPPKWFSGLLVCSLIMPQKPLLFQLVSSKKKNKIK